MDPSFVLIQVNVNNLMCVIIGVYCTILSLLIGICQVINAVVVMNLVVCCVSTVMRSIWSIRGYLKLQFSEVSKSDSEWTTSKEN